MSLPRVFDLGDAALTLEFGHTIDDALVARVQVTAAAIEAAALLGVVEVVPTLRSLTVIYEPLATERDALAAQLQHLAAAPAALPPPARCWRLPACYDPELAEDLPAVAAQLGLTCEAVAALHAGSTLRVAMLGFLPGFAFLTGVAPALRLPRRPEPRVRVPAGSVAVAAGMSAVYPWASPGGWHLLARCAVPMFDAEHCPPSLLAPGDAVRFEPVSRTQHEALLAAVRDGHWRAADHLERT